MVETNNGGENGGVDLSSLRTDTPWTNSFCIWVKQTWVRRVSERVLHETTGEARTCEAWFQLTFRPQKWNLKAHMWYQLSPFPSSNAAIAMQQHHPGNIHQSVATPRYSATPWYVLIQVPNVIDTISKR